MNENEYVEKDPASPYGMPRPQKPRTKQDPMGEESPQKYPDTDSASPYGMPRPFLDRAGGKTSPINRKPSSPTPSEYPRSRPIRSIGGRLNGVRPNAPEGGSYPETY